MEQLKALVNNDNVFNTFFNLSERWEDEKYYEDFNDYVKAMKHSVEKVIGEVIIVKGSKRPFGLVFAFDNGRKMAHVYLKHNNTSAWLAAKILNNN